VSGNGINWAICKFAPCRIQISIPVSYQSKVQKYKKNQNDRLILSATISGIVQTGSGIILKYSICIFNCYNIVSCVIVALYRLCIYQSYFGSSVNFPTVELTILILV